MYIVVVSIIVVSVVVVSIIVVSIVVVDDGDMCVATLIVLTVSLSTVDVWCDKEDFTPPHHIEQCRQLPAQTVTNGNTPPPLHETQEP